MKLGFIGLGRMGAAMAANLVKAGHDVTVFNRTPGRSGALIELGAHEAANVAGVCDGEAVITMLADDDAASGIALGEGGLTTHLRKGAIHLSMSTISVALSKSLSRAHAHAGQRYAAAPVFGRPDMAAAAKLFIVCAGDPATIDACQPLFRAMGQKAFPMGNEPSAANLVKLSGNFLLASAIEALGEAVALIGKAGIDKRGSDAHQVALGIVAGTVLPRADKSAAARDEELGPRQLLRARVRFEHLGITQCPRRVVCARVMGSY